MCVPLNYLYISVQLNTRLIKLTTLAFIFLSCICLSYRWLASAVVTKPAFVGRLHKHTSPEIFIFCLAHLPVLSGVQNEMTQMSMDQWEHEFGPGLFYVISVLPEDSVKAKKGLRRLFTCCCLVICRKNIVKWKQVLVLVGGLTIRNRSALSAWNREWTTRQHRTAGRETPGAPGKTAQKLS